MLKCFSSFACGPRTWRLFGEFSKSLLRFAGISRRFEFRGTTAGVTFIDDYAHLPAEVSAAVAAASAMAPSRLVCVFQPHRYSRLKNLWKDFSNSFDGVDTLVAADVYSAGEMPLPGVTGELIVQAVSAGNGSMDINGRPDWMTLSSCSDRNLSWRFMFGARRWRYPPSDRPT